MRAIRLGTLSAAQLREPDHACRTARDARLRIRASMVLLAAERGMVAAEIAAVVREHEAHPGAQAGKGTQRIRGATQRSGSAMHQPCARAPRGGVGDPEHDLGALARRAAHH
jgi:hypothetical protein